MSEKFESIGGEALSSLQTRLQELFPDSVFEEIEISKLKTGVRVLFENEKGKNFDHGKETNFELLGKLTISSGDVFYLAQESGSKTFEFKNVVEQYKRLYLYEEDEYGNMIGYTKVSNAFESESSYVKNKPYVSRTQTELGYLKYGHATKRLEVMNATTKSLYDLVLCSGSYKSSEDPSARKRLVKAGKAYMFEEYNGDIRYKFIDHKDE